MNELQRKICTTLLLAASIVGPRVQAEQIYVTIGEGTTKSNAAPYTNEYPIGSCLMIYDRHEISAIGSIQSIAFYVASRSGYHTPDRLQIYIGNSPTSEFSNIYDARDASNMALVYDGSPALGKNTGWEEIILDTPYEYDGKSNLVIAIGRQSQGRYYNIYYNSTSASKQCLYRTSSSESEYGNPLNSSLPFKEYKYRPNIRFCIMGNHTDVETVTIEDIVYEVCNDCAYIKGHQNISNNNPKIQSYITRNGKNIPVTSIAGNAFKDCTTITDLTIPASIQIIYNGAFSGCTNLRTVTIEDCSTPLSIATSATDIGAFCDSPIESLYIGRDLSYNITNNTHEEAPFYNRSLLSEVTFGNMVKNIPYACFERCSNLTQINLPNTLENIDEYAFFGCSSLPHITLPNSLKRLGAHALQMCTMLTTANIPTGVEKLEEFCLSRTALTEVQIPDNVKSIEAGAFHWCDKLKQVSMPKRMDYIGPYAFKYCSELEKIEVPEGVDSIAMHTFYHCTKLTDLKLNEGLKWIGDFGIFDTGLKEIKLPSTLQHIGQFGLARNAIEELKIPASCIDLRTGAFYYNLKLRSLTLPEGITVLSDRLLEWCRELNYLNLPEELTTLGSRSLFNVPMKQIHWPSTLTTIGYQALGSQLQNTLRIIPASVTDISTMAFYNSYYPNSRFYSFSEKIIPVDAFKGQNLYGSTLYVLPKLLTQYWASELGSRFGAILPIGDTNGDGQLTIADITEEVQYMAESRPADLKAGMGNHDTNLDDQLDVSDLNYVKELLLEPKNPVDASELNLIDETEEFETTTEPSANCQIASISGILDNYGPVSLDLLNQIRLEAYLEGTWKNEYEHHSIEEYHPYIWSTELERSARIRALEISITWSHNGLNGKRVPDRHLKGAELLACGRNYDMLWQLEAYYSEKSNWMLKTSGVTGHYEGMINSDMDYVGLAGYKATGCMYYTRKANIGQDIETFFLPTTGLQRFNLDVLKDYFEDYYWSASLVDGNLREQDDVYQIKDTDILKLNYHQNISYRYFEPVIDDNMTYSVSDPEVAEFYPGTSYLFGKKAGTATITATNGEVSSSISIQVSCDHTYEYGEPDEKLKVHAKCIKCGSETEAAIPTSFTVKFNNQSSPADSYVVGEEIEVYGSILYGTDPYNKLIIECDRPDLLDTPYHFENAKTWKVLGVGDVNVTARLQYNPSVSQTYKFHLVEPSE